MRLTVEIHPEFEPALARLAADSGCEIDTYAARVLEEAAGSAPLPEDPRSLREIFQKVRSLTEDLDFSRSRDIRTPIDFS